MDTRVFCVYNLARRVFLSSKATAVDGVNEPLKILKVLVGGLGLDKESGLWIFPLSANPSIPRLFPFDLLYLDQDQRVVEAAEIVPGADFPLYRREVASALVLASKTLESTQTRVGDRMIICVEEEIDREIAAADASIPEPIIANARSSGGRLSGHFEKNGKEQRAPVNAASRERSSPVGAGRVDVAVPVATAVVEPVGAPAAVPTEDLEKAKRVSDASGVSAGTAEKPDQSGVSRSIEGDSRDQAKAEDAIPGERRAVAAAQSIIEEREEQPEAGSQSVVIGQQGGVEDLFSNWVDAPSQSYVWVPRNPRPGGPPTLPSSPEVVASKPPEKETPGVASESKASDALQSQQAPEPKKAGSDTATVAPNPIPIEQPQVSRAAPPEAPPQVQPPIPTNTSVSQSSQATTFTVANTGIWRASAHTATSSLPAVPSPGTTRQTAPVVEEQTSKARKASDQEKPTPVVKAEGSKPDDKTILPVNNAKHGSRDEVASSSLSQIVKRESPVSSTKAGNDSVVAIPETTRPKEAANNSGAGLTAKSVATDEKLRPSVATAAVESAVKSPTEVRVAKTGVSTQNGAVIPKSPKVESKAVAPAKSTGPPVQQKGSIERTEANGKAKSAPPSLGERFRRWLNPATPVVASDRRRAHRRYVPGMVAHYYTGGAPKPHEVADISMSGFYLLTEERWMPQTMIQMTLQKPCAKGERKQSITVLSRIVRRGSDGVAAEFVMPEGLDPMSHDVQPSQATDRFSLARFL